MTQNAWLTRLPFTARGLGALIIAQVVAQGATFAVEGSLFRHLGATALGSFAVAASIPLGISVGLVGALGVSISRSVAQANERRDADEVTAYLRLGLGLTLAVTAVLTSALLMGSSLLNRALLGQENATLFVLFSLAAPASTIAGVALAAARALGRTRPDLGYRFAESTTRLLAAPAIYLADASATTVAAIYLAAAWIGLLAAIAPIRHELFRTTGHTRAVRKRPFIATAAWQAIGESAWLLTRRADLLAVSLVSGPNIAGFYRLATLVASLGSLAVTGVGPFFGPSAARRLVTSSELALRYFSRVVRMALLISAPVFMATIAVPDLFVRLFASNVSIVTTTLSVLILLNAVDVATGPGGILLVMAGRANTVTADMLAAAGLEIALLLILVPPFGPFGAATAALLAIVALKVLLLVGVRRTLKGQLFDLYTRRTFAIFAGALAIALVIRTPEPGCASILGLFALTVAFWSVAIVFALSSEDRADVARLRHGAGPGVDEAGTSPG